MVVWERIFILQSYTLAETIQYEMITVISKKSLLWKTRIKKKKDELDAGERKIKERNLECCLHGEFYLRAKT